ncbi:MAG: hypothetical protein WCO33_00375 [bacterium]
MATLGDTTRNTRRFVIGFGAFVILAVIINTCAGILSCNSLGGRLFGCTPPGLVPVSKEDRLFGDLPLINIPSLTLAPTATPVFSLETQTGKLPTDLPLFSYVYKYKEPRQTLTSRDEAISQASSLGFTSDPVELNSTELKWLSPGNKSLTLDKISKSVLLESDFTKNNDAKTVKPFTSYQSTYESTALSYGLSTGAFNTNFNSAKTTSNYLIYDDNYQLKKSKSPDTTEVVLVNFYKKFQLDPNTVVTTTNSNQVDPEKLTEVLGINPKIADTRIIMGTNTSTIYYMSSKNWYVEPASRGVYSTISVSGAWDTVQSGKGSLVYIKKLDNDYIDPEYSPLDVANFYVIDISMKFYESLNFQNYLIPIYVFTGNARLKDGSNAEFVIYTPAVIMKDTSK